MRLALFIVALVPSAALGQTVTTNCYTDTVGNTRCTSNGQQPDHSIQDFVNSYREGSQAATNAWGDALRSRRERRAAEEAQDQKQTAARMIIAGDCAGAERYALDKGNFALAREVRDYCGR